MHVVSESGGLTEIITEIIEIIFFIEQAMQALSTYNEKIKTCLNTLQNHL